jgi:membrane associated rhomboid family serine protease
MRDAAVGFQCPTCVAEGLKNTRAGRTPYGGLRPSNPGFTSMVLIAINAAVWLAIVATGGNGSRLVDQLALRPRGLCLSGGNGFDVTQAQCAGNGTWLPGFADGAYWQVLTSGFTHVTILHIGFNMFALWVIGPQLELALGRTRFLALYFLSLLAGSTVVLWAAPEFQPTLGASGAIYGLFAALLVLAVKVGGDVRQLLVLIAVNVFITFAVPNISWQGHLGGFFGGALVVGVLVYAPKPKRAAYQVAGLSAIGVALVVAIVVRTLALG